MSTTNGIFEVSLNNANEALEGGKKDRVEQIIARVDKWDLSFQLQIIATTLYHLQEAIQQPTILAVYRSDGLFWFKHHHSHR